MPTDGGGQEETSAEIEGSAAFHTTRWTVVASAGSDVVDAPERRDAFAALIRSYWYPIYAFARRRGHAAGDASDQVQAFFAALLERNDLANADAARGRFRSYLLRCFIHFAANEWDRANALKRGGGRALLSLDDQWAEDRFHHEPASDEDPESIYQRAWARSLLEEVMMQLRSEYDAGGKGEVFERLKPMLSGEPDPGTYAEIAQEIGSSEGAIKVAAHRLRKRFGELLRREIAHTVRSAEDVEDELRGLFDALS